MTGCQIGMVFGFFTLATMVGAFIWYCHWEERRHRQLMRERDGRH